MAYYVTKFPTWRQTMLNAMLTAMSTIPGTTLIVSGVMKLFQGIISFNPLTPIATFTAAIATFTGYANVNLPALTGPLNVSSNTRGMLASANFVVGANPATTNTITGYYVDQNVAADWVIAETFPTGIPMVNAGDFINLDVTFPLFLLPTGS